jgi:hypothetical protein
VARQLLRLDGLPEVEETLTDLLPSLIDISEEAGPVVCRELHRKSSCAGSLGGEESEGSYWEEEGGQVHAVVGRRKSEVVIRSLGRGVGREVRRCSRKDGSRSREGTVLEKALFWVGYASRAFAMKSASLVRPSDQNVGIYPLPLLSI